MMTDEGDQYIGDSTLPTAEDLFPNFESRLISEKTKPPEYSTIASSLEATSKLVAHRMNLQ
jgi:hypothetical protein